MVPTSIQTMEEAHAELQEIGGLPVVINAEYLLRDNGKFIRRAETDEEFEDGIACAIQKSPSNSCFIHRSI